MIVARVSGRRAQSSLSLPAEDRLHRHVRVGGDVVQPDFLEPARRLSDQLRPNCSECDVVAKPEDLCRWLIRTGCAVHWLLNELRSYFGPREVDEKDPNDQNSCSSAVFVAEDRIGCIADHVGR